MWLLSRGPQARTGGRVLKVGSLFTGIGGFDLGFERAGLDIVWQVEIGPFQNRVLEQHWPNVIRYKDVKRVGKNLEPVDIICGGFPCQDLSMAGKRAGLAGERSGLFYEFVRIISELLPTWVVIENVPGLLSSDGGRDMEAVLGTLAKLGYGWAYRVLDSKFFGVPQQRRRVYIVCHRRAQCASKVLFESGSGEGDTPTSFISGKGLTESSENGSGEFFYIPDTARTLKAKSKDSHDETHETYVAQGRVRRLTPTEYERLQGFPDNWTAVDGDNTARSPRYKSVGNAVTVNVAEWLGRRLIEVDRSGAEVSIIGNLRHWEAHEKFTVHPLSEIFPDLSYVYSLKLTGSRWHYIGSTNNLAYRLVGHNLGNTKFTKRYLPVEVFQAAVVKDRDVAYKLEYLFHGDENKKFDFIRGKLQDSRILTYLSKDAIDLVNQIHTSWAQQADNKGFGSSYPELRDFLVSKDALNIRYHLAMIGGDEKWLNGN